MAQTKTNMGVGAGLLAAGAAAAAGYYFYASKNAKKNRRIAAKWAQNLKNDVVKQAKKAKTLDRAQVLSFIDKAAGAYETVRSVNKRDLERAAKELKDNWRALAEELSSSKKRPASSKKTARKSASGRSTR